VGIGLIRYAKQPVLRILGVLYPLAVVLTIVVTGNHFIFDALAGAAVLAVGFMIASLPRLRRKLTEPSLATPT
jgi:PAP2 superfamily